MICSYINIKSPELAITEILIYSNIIHEIDLEVAENDNFNCIVVRDNETDVARNFVEECFI